MSFLSSLAASFAGLCRPHSTPVHLPAGRGGRDTFHRRETVAIAGKFCLLWATLIAVALLPAQAQEVFYIHTDALGTVVAETDANGNVVKRSEYEPYGRVLNRPVTNGPGYTGHVEDAATGLTYMQQRYYDPQLAVFLSVDPVTAYNNPVSQFHRYRYANNNPYKFTDPDGRVVETPWDALNVAVGVASFVKNVATGNFAAAAVDAAGVAVDIAATATPGVPGGAGFAISAARTANEVPATLARVIPNGVPASSLGRPGATDVFVTAADDIAGMNAAQIADRLTIPASPTGFNVIEFATPQSGLASPVFRSDPGFVGGGVTAGGAREFVVPNGAIPRDAVTREVR